MRTNSHLRRGVSPVLATIMMVVVGTSASIIAYTFSSGMTGTQIATASEQLLIENVKFAFPEGIVIERTWTEGVSEATFSFSTEPTIDGRHSVQLHVANLQDVHEGIKIGIDSPYTKLTEIDAGTISLKVHGDLLEEAGYKHSPYPIIIIDLGEGTLVSLHATDSGSGGPRNTVTGTDWMTLTPAFPEKWNGFLVDGTVLGFVLGIEDNAWPYEVKTLSEWHTEIENAGYTGYTVKYLAVGYGFLYPNFPGTATAYIDDLTVNDVTYNFEPRGYIGVVLRNVGSVDIDVQKVYIDKTELTDRTGGGITEEEARVAPPLWVEAYTLEKAKTSWFVIHMTPDIPVEKSRTYHVKFVTVKGMAVEGYFTSPAEAPA